VEHLEERRREREERLRKARRFAEEVRRALGKATVVVIGSTCRGDFNAWSDIDVVVISDSLPENPLHRLDLLADLLEPGIEAIPLRREDAIRLAEKGSPVAEEIVSCIALADDLNLLDLLRGILSKRRGNP